MKKYDPGLNNHWFGWSVASAGDVNKDGFDDIIIGAPKSLSGGRVIVISGIDGDTLYNLTGEMADDDFGTSVASAGDVDRDGYDDIIIGAAYNSSNGTFAGKVYVFSGRTGDTLYEFHGEAIGDLFGISVASGDFNNDKWSDLLVGAFFNDDGAINAGKIYVFSGRNGDTLFVFTGNDSVGEIGYSVASAGDVNNDGFEDIVLGSNFGSGQTFVFSGQSGDTIYHFIGSGNERLGSSVASAGDVNNDGYDDIIVGAENNSTEGPSAGRAYVFSGQTGDTLYVFTGEANGDFFGNSVAGTGDVDNDGYDDVIIGAHLYGGFLNNAGRAYVFSGQTGDTLYILDGETPSSNFGTSVASCGDVNGDGYDDVVIGAPFFHSIETGFSEGRVYVFTGGNYCCGDVNNDTIVNLSDIQYLQYYYFECGTQPNSLWGSDVNCDGNVDIGDLLYLADYINGSGPEPCCQ